MRLTYLLSGGRHGSSSAGGGAAASAASPPSDPARCCSWLRRRAVKSAARRRLSRNADGSWPTSMAAKSSRPRARTVPDSATRTLIVCPWPSSRAISPSICPGPACATSERLGGDDQRARGIARRHPPVAVALGVLAPERVPEAHEREVGLEHLVVRPVPAVVERDAGRDQRPAGAETEVGR